MPRRKIVEKRQIDPDPRYNSVLVSKFTNGIMERGKKSVAQHISVWCNGYYCGQGDRE